MPPVPHGASSRGPCPPPPSPRAGPAIGAMRSHLEGQRHGQGSTGALRPGNTCRGSAPAPGPARRALWHGTRGGRARDEAMAGPGDAGLDDGGRLELGGHLVLGPDGPLEQRGIVLNCESSSPFSFYGGQGSGPPCPPLRQGGNDRGSVNQESGICSLASLSPLFRFLLTEANLAEAGRVMMQVNGCST